MGTTGLRHRNRRKEQSSVEREGFIGLVLPSAHPSEGAVEREDRAMAKKTTAFKILYV